MAESRKRWVSALKLLVGVGLLAYVFTRVDWSEFLEGLRHADPVFLTAYVLINAGMLFISTIKWSVLLRPKEIHFSLGALYRLYLIGYFFNHVMPSTVGGDAVRVYQLGRATRKVEDVLASIFVERLSGFTILLLLAAIAIALNAGMLGDPRLGAGLVAGCAVAYAVLMWMILDDRAVQLFTRSRWLPLADKAGPKVEQVHWAIQSYRHHLSIWPAVMALSVLFYTVIIGNATIGVLGFGGPASFWQLALAIPVILLISMLPISVGGLGLLEWGYFAVFEAVGLSGTLGLSVALLNRVAGLLAAGVGGLLYATTSIDGEGREGDDAEAVEAGRAQP